LQHNFFKRTSEEAGGPVSWGGPTSLASPWTKWETIKSCFFSYNENVEWMLPSSP
jgi:hypothetical protein